MAVLQVPPLDISYPTLGIQLKQFIEERCVFGPGSLEGEPARLDDEKLALLCRLYEVHPQGHHLECRRRFNRGGVELRKGVAKTEFAAWILFCELHPEAPVRGNGFHSDGSLREGRPVKSPYIPMMAVTEKQVEELAFAVLKQIVEVCPDAHHFAATDEKILRVVNGRAAGEAVAVSNAPGSRDGARTTCQHFDEPHRLFMPRMRDAHETMLQNMPKRPLEDPWTFYTSTAGQPGQNSIEEDVRAEAESIEKGEVEDPSLFFFSRWAGEEHDDLSTVEKRIAAVADATGPIGEWGPGQFERIAKDYDRKGVDKAYWERVWLNRWRKSGSQAFNMLKVENDLLVDDPIPDGAFVTAGFDGARWRDATALVITEIETGHQQLLGCWERPENVDVWEVPEDLVTAQVDDMMGRYEVWRTYCDPWGWDATIASWAGRHPDRVIEWATSGGGSIRRTAGACRAYSEAVESEEVHFSANPWRDTLIRHLGHAGKRELTMLDDQGQPLWVMAKQDSRLQDKMDAAMAGMLSWTACLDARREGAKPKPKGWLPRRIY